MGGDNTVLQNTVVKAKWDCSIRQYDGYNVPLVRATLNSTSPVPDRKKILITPRWKSADLEGKNHQIIRMEMVAVYRDYGINEGDLKMFSEIYKLADQVGAIEKVKNRLLDRPDKAAEKLAESLDEMYKMFKALDDEIVRYLNLSFESPDSLNQGRAVLLGMEGGQSRILMNEARGHCHKITNIYEKYLNGWFNRVFTNSMERESVKAIFNNLGSIDATIILAIDQVSFWLTSEAKQTLDLLDAENKIGAGQTVKQARNDVRDDRIRLTEAMSQLRAMQADFIAASKTV